MCPICIGAVSMWVAGATSTGGLGVLLVRKLRANPKSGRV